MHIDKTFVGIVLLLVLLMSAPIAYSQDDSVSRSYSKPFQRYWTQPRTVPRFGLGVQDRAFVEVGVHYHSIYKHPLSLASRGVYLSADVFVNDKNLLLGPKLGYEFTAGFLGIAADVTYFIDENYNEDGDDRRAWAITPKAGLSILGFANLFYGYQIPLSEERITTISRNRISLVINLNRDYFNLKEAPPRSRK